MGFQKRNQKQEAREFRHWTHVYVDQQQEERCQGAALRYRPRGRPWHTAQNRPVLPGAVSLKASRLVVGPLHSFRAFVLMLILREESKDVHVQSEGSLMVTAPTLLMGGAARSWRSRTCWPPVTRHLSGKFRAFGWMSV